MYDVHQVNQIPCTRYLAINRLYLYLTCADILCLIQDSSRDSSPDRPIPPRRRKHKLTQSLKQATSSIDERTDKMPANASMATDGRTCHGADAATATDDRIGSRRNRMSKVKSFTTEDLDIFQSKVPTSMFFICVNVCVRACEHVRAYLCQYITLVIQVCYVAHKDLWTIKSSQIAIPFVDFLFF